MLIAYTESAKVWNLWDFSKQQALRSTDIIFVEEENAITENLGKQESMEDLLLSDKIESPSAIGSSPAIESPPAIRLSLLLRLSPLLRLSLLLPSNLNMMSCFVRWIVTYTVLLMTQMHILLFMHMWRIILMGMTLTLSLFTKHCNRPCEING